MPNFKTESFLQAKSENTASQNHNIPFNIPNLRKPPTAPTSFEDRQNILSDKLDPYHR